MLSHPISRSYLPFFVGKIIIRQLSSEKTVYPLILHDHHSQHSSPHRQRAYFPFKNGYYIISCYPAPSEEPRLQFNPPHHQHILLSPFFGKNHYQSIVIRENSTSINLTSSSKQTFITPSAEIIFFQSKRVIILSVIIPSYQKRQAYRLYPQTISRSYCPLFVGKNNCQSMFIRENSISINLTSSS